MSVAVHTPSCDVLDASLLVPPVGLWKGVAAPMRRICARQLFLQTLLVAARYNSVNPRLANTNSHSTGPSQLVPWFSVTGVSKQQSAGLMRTRVL